MRRREQPVDEMPAELSNFDVEVWAPRVERPVPPWWRESDGEWWGFAARLLWTHERAAWRREHDGP